MSTYVKDRLDTLTAESGDSSPVLRYHKLVARRERMRKMRGPQMLYVIPGRHCIKIGISWNVHERWQDLKTANPHLERPYYISLPVKRAKAIEAAVHLKLSAYRITGEWFSCSRYLAAETVEVLVTEDEYEHAGAARPRPPPEAVPGG